MFSLNADEANGKTPRSKIIPGAKNRPANLACLCNKWFILITNCSIKFKNMLKSDGTLSMYYRDRNLETDEWHAQEEKREKTTLTSSSSSEF